MKKILSFLVAAPLMLGVLAGCGPTTNPDQEALPRQALQWLCHWVHGIPYPCYLFLHSILFA